MIIFFILSGLLTLLALFLGYQLYQKTHASAFYLSITEALPIGVVVLNHSEKILYVNQYLKAIYKKHHQGDMDQFLSLPLLKEKLYSGEKNVELKLKANEGL